MKFAITGHTSGIGKAIKEYLKNKGHSVIGFSRTNGYNIENSESRKKIVELSQDCDGFINNAYVFNDESQFNLLKEIHASWIGNKKVIVNIGSRSSDLINVENFPWVVYGKEKKKQDDFCHSQTQGPWILNLKPGTIDTPLAINTPGQKMHVDSVVKVLQFVFDNIDSFKVRSITFTV